jgi:hypothetical protein
VTGLIFPLVKKSVRTRDSKEQHARMGKSFQPAERAATLEEEPVPKHHDEAGRIILYEGYFDVGILPCPKGAEEDRGIKAKEGFFCACWELASSGNSSEPNSAQRWVRILPAPVDDVTCEQTAVRT